MTKSIKINNFIYFLPSIIVMIVIFVMSNDPVSGEKSSKLIELLYKLINFFINYDFNEYYQNLGSFIIRKIAHISEYMILTLTYYLAISKNNFKNYTFRQIYFYSGLFAVLYSISDEYHQTFVKGRVGTYEDVLIDSIGIFLGYFIIKIINKLWKI
jgi:VanZ family protein